MIKYSTRAIIKIKTQSEEFTNPDDDKTLEEVRTADERTQIQILCRHPLRTCISTHSREFIPERQAKADKCDRLAAAHAKIAKEHDDQHDNQL
ncbi:hypothetical protein Pmani_037859 [Petrolisthes manimaculis]|uniref:Uncharacterized protein n=1 Tax=Petrolisthes manimaculis TaxID=1843537 RepID=A0AAE1NFH0_9EUCA|nr:hypothetical protein Pmani_037859 [Petrolisthes manimaculis]